MLNPFYDYFVCKETIPETMCRLSVELVKLESDYLWSIGDAIVAQFGQPSALLNSKISTLNIDGTIYQYLHPYSAKLHELAWTYQDDRQRPILRGRMLAGNGLDELLDPNRPRIPTLRQLSTEYMPANSPSRWALEELDDLGLL